MEPTITTETVTISRQDYLGLIRLAHLAFTRLGCIWPCDSEEDTPDGHFATCREGRALRKRLEAHICP